jgi:biotin-dependent carboxylase-like uncharacterized protein
MAVTGLATVQDAGRPGHLHEGVPPGGALVPAGLAIANWAAENAANSAAIETFGRLRGVARGAVRIGRDDGTWTALRDGDFFEVDCVGRRVTYLAVRGGIDVPLVLGGRGTLLTASLGGHEGRALRRGDVLRAGTDPSVLLDPARPALSGAGAEPIRVVPGPDLDCAPLEGDTPLVDRLLASTFRVDPRSDRIGIRLDGPRLSRSLSDRGPSRPMVRGAVQLPPDGTPIVLGPDHPTTGGYPVIATVTSLDLGRLSALPIGAPVRFTATPAG